MRETWNCTLISLLLSRGSLVAIPNNTTLRARGPLPWTVRCEPEDSHCRSGCGRRLCRRPYGTSWRGRDVHRSLARARRAHAKAWLTRDARHGRAGILRGRARPARDGCAATRQGEAGRHRLRVHEVVRHGVGNDAHPAISGTPTATWSRCRIA